MSKAVCAACRRKIDGTAKLCPYCGSNPVTGERIDTQAILEEVFHPRKISTTESVLDYARQRQGMVIAISAGLVFLILAALHQFVTNRNANATAASNAVPLTEITDLSKQPHDTPQPMPELKFQYDGHPETMKRYLVEPGAVTPPGVNAPAAPAAPAPGPVATPPPPPPPR